MANQIQAGEARWVGNAVRACPVAARQLAFSAAVLQAYDGLAYDIEGALPGPRLCVMAGMHVNEVAGIAAARDLIQHFSARAFRGRVSILPIVNTPAVPSRAQYLCPVDGKNINFCFPGSCIGSFSDALADALLNEWAADADVLIDLHGGDLCEDVAPFTVLQLTGDASFDAVNLALAAAFDPAIIVRLPPADLAAPGRSCTGRARQRRHAAFAEAGANGRLDTRSLRYHVDGVLRIAARLGMVDQAPPCRNPPPFLADRYHWVRAEAGGWCDYAAEAGNEVRRGATLATIANAARHVLQTVVAPAGGRVLWRCTHPLVTPGGDLFGIGSQAATEEPSASLHQPAGEGAG